MNLGHLLSTALTALSCFTSTNPETGTCVQPDLPRFLRTAQNVVVREQALPQALYLPQKPMSWDHTQNNNLHLFIDPHAVRVMLHGVPVIQLTPFDHSVLSPSLQEHTLMLSWNRQAMEELIIILRNQYSAELATLLEHEFFPLLPSRMIPAPQHTPLRIVEELPPMPFAGIVTWQIPDGIPVRTGDALGQLEAMKMLFTIRSPSNGIFHAIRTGEVEANEILGQIDQTEEVPSAVELLPTTTLRLPAPHSSLTFF